MGVWAEDQPRGAAAQQRRAEASFHCIYSRLNITWLDSASGAPALMNERPRGEFLMNDGEFLTHLL